MKSVIMIPYFFPPEGAAGVYRPLRFVRQLAKMGWNTTIVSAEPYSYQRYDPDLLTLIPTSTETIRVQLKDPWQSLQAWRGKRLQGKLSGGSVETGARVHRAHQAPFRSWVREGIRRAEAYYYFPDLAKPWIRPAVKATRQACLRKTPKVLWATIGPVSTGIVAQQASQSTGVPYVLDFRDPWELYYYESEMQRSKGVTRSAQRTLYNLFEGAQAVVFLFSRMAESYWRAYKGALDPSKIHIIPNGYEGVIESFRVPNDHKCTILYSGTLASYRFDTLLQALYDLKKTYPTVAKQLKFLFVGDGMDSLTREADSLGLSDIVETASPVSFDEVTLLFEKAHGFLILGRHPERKGHELVAGAKLFGYLKARKPIIGILPQDETREILTNVGVETLADASSMIDISRILRKFHSAWSENQLSTLLPNKYACESFSSEPQTLALMRALEGLPSEAPFVPGKVDIPASLRDLIENESLWYRKQ